MLAAANMSLYCNSLVVLFLPYPRGFLFAVFTFLHLLTLYDDLRQET